MSGVALILLAIVWLLQSIVSVFYLRMLRRLQARQDAFVGVLSTQEVELMWLRLRVLLNENAIRSLTKRER